MANRPCDQSFSTWISEDKRIYFEVDEYGDGNGTLKTEDRDTVEHHGLQTDREREPESVLLLREFGYLPRDRGLERPGR